MAFKKQKSSNWWKTQGGATELTLTQTGAGSGKAVIQGNQIIFDVADVAVNDYAMTVTTPISFRIIDHLLTFISQCQVKKLKLCIYMNDIFQYIEDNSRENMDTLNYSTMAKDFYEKTLVYLSTTRHTTPLSKVSK